MDRRFVQFLVLSLAIMTGWMLFQATMFPPQPAPPKGDQNADKKDADDKQEPKANGADPAPVIDAGAETDWRHSFWGALVRRPNPQRWEYLGSLDAGSPFRLLAIFNSRGATIETVTLNERTGSGAFRYRDLEDHSGYLGDLALTDDRTLAGCRVNVVGPGTPAATAEAVGGDSQAGLQVGDVIVQVDDRTVADLLVELKSTPDVRQPQTHVGALHYFLNKTRPKDELLLTVRRGDADQQFRAKLSRHPVEVVRPEPTDEYQYGVSHPLSFLMTLGRWDEERWVELNNAMRNEDWEVSKVERTAQSHAIEFLYRLYDVPVGDGKSGSFEVIKRYRVARTPEDELQNRDFRSYHIDLEIEIRNVGAEAASIAYQLDGPTGLPVEGWWHGQKVHSGWSAAGARDVIWKTEGKGHKLFGCLAIFDNVAKDKPTKNYLISTGREPKQDRAVQYIGVDTRYFAVALMRDGAEAPDKYVYRHAKVKPVEPVSNNDRSFARKTDVSFQLQSSPLKIAPYQGNPSNAFSQKFVIFAGPKQPALLEQYGLEECVAYGWFGWISRPLVWVLHFFYSFVGSYALAVILLTVLVRAGMIPLSRKATRNAQMMQLLKPEMDKIAAQYKNDFEKRSKAQQQLFLKYNYNPFSGCFLMLLQLPIFIGLYRAFSVDIEARGQPLIPGLQWCSNLAAPDMLFRWDSFMPSFLASEGGGWLGPYFNLLPILTLSLFVVQQRMFTPPSGDEQQRRQQRMMMNIMMVLMGFIFFKVDSGLCLYFVTSSLWGVLERKFFPKVELAELEAAASAGGTGSRSAAPGSNGETRKDRAKKRKKKSKGRK